MLKNGMPILFLLCSYFATAQATTQTAVIRLPITETITNEGDSFAIVQVQLSNFTNITIAEKTTGILHHSTVNTADDSTIVGTGKCYLIKGNYYYFGLRLQNKQIPLAGDLISFVSEIPVCYKGLLYDMSCNHILLTNVDGNEFYNWEAPFLVTNAKEEEKYYKQMIADIKRTGTAMLKQMPENNMQIKEGLFAKKKLFGVMQMVTIKELKEFFKYVKARPEKYAGQQWKLSEIFATWVHAGAPQVIL